MKTALASVLAVLSLSACNQTGSVSINFEQIAAQKIESELEFKLAEDTLTWFANKVTYGHFDVHVILQDNRNLSFTLCHQNDWLTDQIHISPSNQAGQFTLQLQNQEHSEILTVQANSSELPTFGICG